MLRKLKKKLGERKSSNDVQGGTEIPASAINKGTVPDIPRSRTEIGAPTGSCRPVPCNRCIRGLFQNTVEEQKHPDFVPVGRHRGWLLYESYKELVNSSKSCVICKAVATSLHEHRSWSDASEIHTFRMRNTYHSDHENSMKTIVWLDGIKQDSIEGFTLAVSPCKDNPRPQLFPSREHLEMDKFLAQSPVWNKLERVTFEDRLPTIQKWLENCTLCHVGCQQDIDQGARPTRLVDVGLAKDSPIHLVQRSDLSIENLRYITLSHRWASGEQHPLETLDENLQQFKDSIPIERLSQTFLDAIEITRGLGVRFIWIDSLCIVQDSSVDWEQEAARMKGVYSGSYLNIAAIDAEWPQGGCFLNSMKPVVVFQGPDEMKKQELRLPVATRSQVSGSILATRGWVLQELTVASRVLYCGRDQLYWQCRGYTWSEDGTLREGKTTLNTRVITSGYEISGDPLDLWTTLVHTYSRLDLTYEKDRLPALAGIVPWFRENYHYTGKEFVLGWWKVFIGKGLAWDIDLQTPKRDTSSNLPSWSWLAARHGVDYNYDRTTQDCILLHKWDVQWAGEPLTSRVLGSTLIIRGFLMTFNCVRQEEPDPLLKYIAQQTGTESAHRAIVNFDFKFGFNPDHPDKLLTADSHGRLTVTALVLFTRESDSLTLQENCWMEFLVLQPEVPSSQSANDVVKAKRYQRMGRGTGYIAVPAGNGSALGPTTLGELLNMEMTDIELI